MRSSNLKPVVCLFGPDGAGKTTHANLLASHLRKHGINAKVAWISSHHLLAHLIRQAFIALGVHVWEKDGTSDPVRNLSWRVLKSDTSRKVWLYIEAISLLLIMIVRVQIPRVLGRQVIVERYVPGSLADLSYMLGSSALNSFPARLLLRVANGNTVFIHLHCDWETHKKRRYNTIESRRYMKHQEKIYWAFARKYAALTIDTSVSPIAEVQGMIRRELLTE